MSNIRKLGYFKPVKKYVTPGWKPGKKIPQKKSGGEKRVHP